MLRFRSMFIRILQGPPLVRALLLTTAAAVGSELPDHSDACCVYWGSIHIDFKAVALSIGIQQAIRQIKLSKLHAGAAVAA
jgi:hypothetical protein